MEKRQTNSDIHDKSIDMIYMAKHQTQYQTTVHYAEISYLVALHQSLKV
jgi:hypothetical protein